MKTPVTISIAVIAIIIALVLGYVVFVKPKTSELAKPPVANNSENNAVIPGKIVMGINKTMVIADGRDFANAYLALFDNQINPIANSYVIITSNRGAKDIFYRSISGSIRLNTDPHGRESFSISSKTEGVSNINIRGKNVKEINQEITFMKPEPDVSLKIYPDGTLVRFSVYPKIWRIIGGKKHAISTAGVFNTYGFEWNKAVTEYNPDVIDAYPNVDLVKEKEGTKVYKLIGCLGRNCYGPPQKHWIPSVELFEKYGFSWDEIIEVSKEEIDSYPRVSLITVSDSDDIYYLTEEGQKRLIPNPEIFASHGYEWDNILFISNDEFIKYPKGKPIE